jgi:hypothetical protein
VVDGHHRLAAYALLGVNTDDALVVKKKNL